MNAAGDGRQGFGGLWSRCRQRSGCRAGRVQKGVGGRRGCLKRVNYAGAGDGGTWRATGESFLGSSRPLSRVRRGRYTTAGWRWPRGFWSASAASAWVGSFKVRAARGGRSGSLAGAWRQPVAGQTARPRKRSHARDGYRRQPPITPPDAGCPSCPFWPDFSGCRWQIGRRALPRLAELLVATLDLISVPRTAHTSDMGPSPAPIHPPNLDFAGLLPSPP